MDVPMSEPSLAVLFDFDGVIADTANVHIAAWERTFALMGWDVPPEACARAAEEDDRAFFAALLDEQGIQGGDIDGWIARKQELTRTLLADEPRLYPGLAELVDQLRGRAMMAVVSTTWRENVAIVLGTSDLAGAFQVLIGKEDVSATKPDPEPYRLALSRLGIAPSKAVALEDSPLGLTSARTAGLACIAVGHRKPAGVWSSEVPFLSDLRDLEAIQKAFLETIGLTF